MKDVLAKLVGFTPLLARSGVGVFLRAVADNADVVDVIAQHVYDDEHDGEAEVPWDRLPSKERKVWRQRVKASLGGLDKVVKAATTG